MAWLSCLCCTPPSCSLFPNQCSLPGASAPLSAPQTKGPEAFRSHGTWPFTVVSPPCASLQRTWIISVKFLKPVNGSKIPFRFRV